MDTCLQNSSGSGCEGPLSHLDWALRLPRCTGALETPEAYRSAINWHCADPSAVLSFRTRQLAFWRHRQRVTAPAWLAQYAGLPAHVRSILGPEKNLVLLAEMLEAARSPDLELPADLADGFPLVGEIPRSGAMRPCTGLPGESPEQLLLGAPEQNERILERVRAARSSDANVAEALRERTRAEVGAGQAGWRPLPSDLAGVVLSPRFAADEGCLPHLGGNNNTRRTPRR